MSSNDMNRTVREFYKAVEGVKNKKPLGYDTQATVRRIEDGVAWVHIPDGVDETPARLTISAKVGDVVQVRIVNGRAFLVGNASAPPTDNTEAVKAMGQAGLAAEAASIARQKADEAIEDAATAHEAAMSAQDSADIAQDAAENAQRDADDVAANLKSVVAGATTVEKAVSVMQTALEAVVDYDPTTDTTKEYFWHDANGAHVLGADSGFRNDIDSTGMHIVDVNTENEVESFGTETSIKTTDGTELAHFGYGLTQGASSTTTAPYYTLGSRATTTDEYNASRTYALGDLCIYNNALWACRAEISIPEAFNAAHWAYAIGYYSTVEGDQNTAALGGAHAEGVNTSALGYAGHSEGKETIAAGYASHAEGEGSIAKSLTSHASGLGTIANGKSQTAIGEYNIEDNGTGPNVRGVYAFIIGNGTSKNARSNAMAVDWSGNVTAADFVAGSMTLATMFNTSKMSQPSIYQSRIDNMTLYHYTIGRMCFVHGIFRIAISGAWADMAVATGFPTPAYNTSIPLTAANSSSHDSVICYINPQGSLCIHSVLAQYTWVTVSGYYQRNL